MVVAEVPVGTRLGKYRITGRLGKGGMGVVYAGEDTHLRRPVAIKVLAESVASEPQMLGRFLLEARAAARLNHPNVVTVHDVGQSGDTHYIVMELVNGGSAQARLDAQGRMPWPEASRLVADICRGLMASHGAGLIHRDVKPANFLLAADGTAKLADFGLTKAPALGFSGFTQPGTVIGTAQYMSPEHCSGEQLDERTDIYSLGAAYFTLLVGRPPFDMADPAMILFSHCSAPLPDPRAFVPELPLECARVVARAMAKARSARFASADEMLRELFPLCTAVAVPVTRALPKPAVTARFSPAKTHLQPGSAVPKRRRRLALVLGGLVVTLTCVALFQSSGLFSSRPAPAVLAADKKGPSPSPSSFPPKGEEELPVGVNFPIVLKPRPIALAGHQGAAKSVSIAGGRLVSAGADGVIRVWALDSGSLLQTMKNPAALDAVALSPDGKWIAAGGRLKSVTLWNAETGEGIAKLSDLPNSVCALAFSPSGKQLAIATETDLQLCEFEAPATFSRRDRLLERQYVVSSVAFSANGKRLAACTNGSVFYWDLPSRQRSMAPGSFQGRLTAVALSEDGSRLAFGSYHGTLHLWEPDSGQPPAVWSDKEGSVATAAFAPRSGALVYGGEWGGPIRVCDLVAATTARIPTGINGVVSSVCFSPDGRILAAACADGTVRLWEVVPADRAK